MQIFFLVKYEQQNHNRHVQTFSDYWNFIFIGQLTFLCAADSA